MISASTGKALAWLSVLIVVGGLTAAVLWYRGWSRVQSAVYERYNAVSERHQARAYERPEDTPSAWSIQRDVSAAQAYQEAWERCPQARERFSGAGHEGALGAAVDVLTGRAELEEPTGPPPPACAGLFVEGAPAELVATLDASLCEALKACEPAFDRISAGSRAASARSPLATFQAWKPKEGALPFTELARLMLVRGALQASPEEPDPFLDAIFAVMRFGLDLGRGASVIPLSAALHVEGLAQEALIELLVRQPLEAEQRERLLSELAYLDRSPLRVEEVLESEYLESAVVAPDDRLKSPLRAHLLPVLGPEDEGLAADLLRRMTEVYGPLFELDPGAPLTERAQAYRDAAERLRAASNPLVSLSGHMLEKAPRRVAQSRARRRMLGVALMMQAGRDEEPWPGAWLDPMTGAPFARRRVEQRCEVEAAWEGEPLELALPCP